MNPSESTKETRIAEAPKTARGRETWDRMVSAAADLMHLQGVQATTVDQVLEASGTGKSQFYSYFDSKDDLVRAVLEYQAQAWLDRAEPSLARLDTWEGFEDWFSRILAFQAKHGFRGGCPVGSMAAEMADADEELRPAIAAVFDVRRGFLFRGLAAMKERGELTEDADPEQLSRFVLAAAQGGLMLSATAKDGSALRDALAGALAHLRSFAVEGEGK